VLDKCISINQSAFVPGRSILDNAMVAIEIVHYMKAKAKGKSGDVALKLDISKAYDRLDWDNLREIMIQMGFSSCWVNWIMLCVETVDYSVLVNGASVGPIVPGRGLFKVIPSHLICSSFVLKVFPPLFVKLNVAMILKVL